MLQRHVGPRLANSAYPTSGNGGVAAGATVMPTRSLLARDNDPMDYDMPEDLNAAVPGGAGKAASSESLGDMSQAAGGRGKEPLPQKLNEPPDVDIANLDILDNLIPRPPKQRQKGKKQANRNHGGHSKHHRRNYLNKPSGRPT